MIPLNTFLQTKRVGCFKDSYNLGFVLNDKIRPGFFCGSFHNCSKFLRCLFLSFTTILKINLDNNSIISITYIQGVEFKMEIWNISPHFIEIYALSLGYDLDPASYSSGT